MAVDGDFQAAKAGRADDMLERFALAAAADEFAQIVHFLWGQGALEFEVELHARELEHVRQQEFGMQAGRIDALFREKFGAALNGFENGHGRKIRAKIEVQRAKLADANLILSLRRVRGGVTCKA